MLKVRYRLAKSTISQIIAETCDLIWKKLQPTQMPVLKTEDWHNVEEGFRYRWHFPNCIGAIDGKHIVVQCPPKSSTLYYNYKGTYSMVLMAVVDHQYKFKYIDFGEYGSNCDLNVFKNSTFGQAFIQGKLQIPGPKPLPRYDGPPLPHCLIGDEAFAQRKDFMRPYPKPRGNFRFPVPKDQMLFNWHLSRTRNIVENAFGILAQRWCIFMHRICLGVWNVECVVKATVVLHNWLCEERPVDEIKRDLIASKIELPPNREACMRDMPHMHGYHTAKDAANVRDHFKNFFNGVGAISWQNERMQKKYGI